MFRRPIVLITLVGLLAIALAACGGGASNAGSGGKDVTVTATEFKFDPATINVSPGQIVNLTLKNNGSIEHTWVIKAINFKLTVASGKSGTKTFTAPTDPGTYPIECDVAGHKEAGMTGQLIVK